VPGRLRVDRAYLALATLVLASTAVRVALSRAVDAPWIAPDEHVYGLLGRSLVAGDGLTILGEQVAFYSALYPLFIGVPFLVADVATAVAAVQVVQAVVMSATAVPVFLWSRRVTTTPYAFVAAGLTVLMPGLAYSGLLMSEALYFPVAVLTAWALAESLDRPSVARQALLLGAVVLALATRLQAVGFVATIVLAISLVALAERSAAPFRRLALTLGALGGLAVTGLAVVFARGDAGQLLGAYATLGEAESYSVLDVASSIAWQAGAVVLLTVAVPLVALGALAWETLRGREEDPAVRALVATAIAYLAVTLVEVGAFASRFVDHITERQLLSVAPPVFVAFAVWLGRGLPRPQPATSIVAVAVAASALLVPLERVATRAAAADALSTIPLEQLRRELAPSTFELVYAGAIALLLLVAVLAPRRGGPAIAALLAVGMAGASIVASREIAERSREERANVFAGAAPSWIDATRVRDVGLFVTGDRLWPSSWHHLFWNDSITSVSRLEGVESPGVMPQEVVTIEPDGRLVTRTGAPPASRHLVTPSSMLLAGEPLGSLPASIDQPGLTLYRLEPPARVRQRVQGLRPNGDLHGGERAEVVVYGCGPGELELTLLGKQGLPTRVRAAGEVVAERAIPPETVWRVAVPAPAGADGSGTCLYELESEGLVGSTRVEFVPAD
jgi:hypothetical protein